VKRINGIDFDFFTLLTDGGSRNLGARGKDFEEGLPTEVGTQAT